MTGSLGARLLAACGLFAVVITGAFGVTLLAIDDLGDAGRETRHTQAVVKASHRMQTLVLDLETSMRGYVLTRQSAFMEPWLAGVRVFPRRAAELERLLQRDAEQRSAARVIVANVGSYIRDYSTPVVQLARVDPAGARSVIRAGEGKRRVNVLRSQFRRLAAAHDVQSAGLSDRAAASGRRAMLIGFAGLAGVLGLFALLAVYLERSIGAPVRRIAGAAQQLAAGDYEARAPERGVAAIAQLGAVFNDMVASVRESGRNLERQAQELTSHRASLERLLEVNNAVLDASQDGIRLVDLDGHTVLANRVITNLTTEVFGLPDRASLKERSVIVERLVDPASYLATMRAIEEDPECVTTDRFELADVGRSFQRTTGPVHDSSGELIGRIIVLREVTAEHSAERLKSELVATVSHEVRTPLAGILGFAELLLHRQADEDTRRSYLETIHGEAVRLTALIDDFLDLQKIDAGRFPLASEPFDLIHVLQSEVELFSMQSGTHQLDFSASHAPLWMEGDRRQVARVVANLLSNAIKYSPASGSITVAATTRDGFHRFSVSDTGLGIPAEQQLRVFERFFRVDTSDARAIGGTGLGLALCREIIVAHGGSIGFESTEGRGSTFWCELPVTGAPPAQRARAIVLDLDPLPYRPENVPDTTPGPY